MKTCALKPAAPTYRMPCLLLPSLVVSLLSSRPPRRSPTQGEYPAAFDGQPEGAFTGNCYNGLCDTVWIKVVVKLRSTSDMALVKARIRELGGESGLTHKKMWKKLWPVDYRWCVRG